MTRPHDTDTQLEISSRYERLWRELRDLFLSGVECFAFLGDDEEIVLACLDRILDRLDMSERNMSDLTFLKKVVLAQ